MGAARVRVVVCAVMSVVVAACGAGEPAVAGAGGSQAAATETIPAYADALAAGWTDVSWSATRNFAATSPVASGSRSLAVTFQSYGGLYLNRSGSALPSGYALELSIHPGTAAGGRLQVAGRWANGTTGSVDLAAYCDGRAIPAGAWTRCRVPLAAIAPSAATLDGFWIMENEGRARPTMYLDEVVVTNAPAQPTVPAAPAGLVATAATASVALSWGAVAGAAGYDVYRAAAAAGPFARLTAAPVAATTYADAAVSAGASYWYQVRAVNAAGAGAASSTATATVPLPATTIAAYLDALATGWTDVSWSATRDFAAAGPVASGSRSLAVTFQAYGGLYLNRSGSALPGSGTLELSVNPGTAAGGRLQVAGRWTNATTGKVDLAAYCANAALPAGAWTRCRIPLSAVAGTASALDGFWIMENEGRARPAMYFDDVVVATTATPPPPPPPTGAVTVAVSPAAAAVDACKAVKLSATVSGTTDGAVTWSVQEGAAGGTVDAAGNYTAPRGDGVAHVVATSRAAPAAVATATITYQERVLAVAIAPTSVAVGARAQAQLSATVTTTCGALVGR